MTNSRLYKMGIVDFEMHSLCLDFLEPYKHLFSERKLALIILRDLKFGCEENCHANIESLNRKLVLFGKV